MPLVYYRSVDDANIYVWNICEKLKDLHTKFPSLINVSNIQKAVVRAMVYTYAGENVEVDYNLDGSPILLGVSKYEHISISHTKSYVVIVLSSIKRYGVDIEHIGRNFKRVASRFLSVNERLQMENSGLKLYNMIDTLAVIWSAKEAMYKLIDNPSFSFTEYYNVRVPKIKFFNKFKALYSGDSIYDNRELDLEYCLIQNHILVWVSF